MMSVAEPAPYLWTREEYYRMADLGLFEGKRVELIEGQVIQMPPMLSPHGTAVTLVSQALRVAFGRGHFDRQQQPLSLGEVSEPEPDVAVVRGEPLDFSSTHPTTAVLVVEVADSSLRYDRTTKASLYARAGIPEYWILNLPQRRLEVYRDPQPEAKAVFGHGYATLRVLQESDVVSPLGAPDSLIPIAQLLPR